MRAHSFRLRAKSSQRFAKCALSWALSVVLVLAFLPTYAFGAQSGSTGTPMAPSESKTLAEPETIAQPDGFVEPETDDGSDAASDAEAETATSDATETSTPEVLTRTLPSSYFLTNLGLATPVKLQSPWGDCWAFAMASAIESSILKASTQFAEEVSSNTPQLVALNNTVDISERAIAWFTHEAQTEETAGNQAGEGYYLLNPSDKSQQLVEGNFEMIASQLIAWQSLVSESSAPYQYNGYDGSLPWYSTGSFDGANDDARMQDWSLDPSLRTTVEVGWHVTGIHRLPDPATLEMDPTTGISTWHGYDANATRKIKHALMDTGAVAIALETATTIPQQVVQGNFVNSPPSDHFTYSTWSQHNGASEIVDNHAVTIVGWDDSYAASNFQGTASGAPPGNGAWLCKNNWGSDALFREAGNAEDSPHWGLPASAQDVQVAAKAGQTVQEGEATGLFWLSYYDHSIVHPTVFDVAPVAESSDTLYQYDYLGASEFVTPSTFSDDVWVANVFESNGAELLEAVTAQTFSANNRVHVQIYVLNNDTPLEELTGEMLDEEASLVTEFDEMFPQPGYHIIELDPPVILDEGQKFIVAEMVNKIERAGDGTPYDASYLNLELAFTDATGGMRTSSKAHAVANPGETFLRIESDNWMSVQDYSDWYARDAAAQGFPNNMEFGNALVKALTSSSTMSDRNQIYKLVKLEPTH